MRRPVNPIGIGWAGPTILFAGTQEQKERYLMPMLAGEEFWCQLFSEPGGRLATSPASAPGPCATATSGSSTARRSGRAARSYARFGILIARTDPDVPKHKGISYFICPMDAPGHRDPAHHEMTGVPSFNEVFFTDVRIPAANLVGDVNDGWRLAKVTLGNERVSLSSGGVLWGDGPTALDLLEAVRAAGRSTDPIAAPAPGRDLHRAHAAGAHPPAHAHGPPQGRAARAGGQRAQDPRPTSTAST